MKGQALPTAAMAAGVIVVFVSMVLVGLLIYGIVSDAFPHDQAITNETMCTTACSNTSATFSNIPVLNDTAMVCFNGTATTPQVMLNGRDNGVCLGYNILGRTLINFTNTSSSCVLNNIECSYTFDEATDVEQTFFTNANNNTFGAFSLISVGAIVLAGVAIVALLLFLQLR